MEQIQADVVAMGTMMDTRVDQLMEIIQNMARQQEEIRVMIMRPVEALNNGGRTVNNLPGVIVNNPNDTLGTQNVVENPGGARNGNLDSNVDLNIQNGQPANLGNPASNQGILVIQVMGNPPPPNHVR